MEFLGGEQRETVVEVESHLVSEDALRTRSCSVGLRHAFCHDSVEQVEILFHVIGIFQMSITHGLSGA